MADDVITEQVTTTDGDQVLPNEALPDEALPTDQVSLESVAKEMGWREKKDWHDGSGKPWVDAREFILRQRDFNERIQNKLELTEAGVQEIKNHFDRELAAERAKHREELKTARREAIKEGDVDEVERIDEELHSSTTETGDTEAKRLREEQLETWKKTNPWYGTHEDLSDIADALAKDLQDKGKTFPEILAAIDKKMKTLVKAQEPEKRRSSEPPVEGEGQRHDVSRKHTIRDLSEPQREALRIFKDQIPGYTDDKYIKALEEQGVLK